MPRFPGPSATTMTSASRTSFAASKPVHTVTASSSPPNACPHVIHPSSRPAARKLGTRREKPPASAAPSVITYTTRGSAARFAPAAIGATIECSGAQTTGVCRRPSDDSSTAAWVSSTLATAVCTGVYLTFITWPGGVGGRGLPPLHRDHEVHAAGPETEVHAVVLRSTVSPGRTSPQRSG